MNLATMTAGSLTRLLASRQISCADVLESVLNEIDRREAQVHAFITVRDSNDLRREAQDVDNRRMRGDTIGPLAGLPVAIKDNICTRGLATTCASRMLANFVPPYDATVIRRITCADGIILGKTNMDEFAMGSTTESSAYGVTRNPHDLDYVPGGTSGGSAAAVAASETILALGSDTGGSIRQPAAFCGVVGFKPTYGRVSRYGLIAYASSLDQIGPVTKDVDDARLLYEVIAGHDPLDATSIISSDKEPADTRDVAAGTIRVGVPAEFFGVGLDPEVCASVTAALDLLERAGHNLVPLTLPHASYAIPTYYIVACAEASSNLARYDGTIYGYRSKTYEGLIDMMSRSRSEGFGAEVKRRIMLGTYTLSAGYYDAYYVKASKVRRLISQDFDAAFRLCDVILHPVAPTAAFRIGEKIDNPLSMYLGDVYSVLANLIGAPAISIPCGTTITGLPIGLQITANKLAESMLFGVAKHLESLLIGARSGSAASDEKG
jgi:aspartyl-tRNA(Asn)/glutamyl-tRNA(Gln) amidotransferase subunit A